MPTHYESELDKLAATYEAAVNADVKRIKAAVAGASQSSIIGVGTGGSFTVASLWCNLHEAYTGRVSRPATSLELICNPTLAAASPVFLISAEGKNPDIIEALLRARRHSARPIHVLTNRGASPLIESLDGLTGVTRHIFELAEKDGYLATNSLLLDSVLVARAYGELAAKGNLPKSFEELTLGNESLSQWLSTATSFVADAVSRGNLIITYSPLLRPIAADLESKLSEGALLYSQVADLRSLAHGRHLWFADRPQDCAVLALVEPSMGALWDHTSAMLPADIPKLTMRLPGATPGDLISGLVAQMWLVSLIANRKGVDVGRPIVPQFGRDIYYIDLPKFIPRSIDSNDRGEQAKSMALGSSWPSTARPGPIQRAREAFEDSIEQQCFRGIVFDYDGTLSPSQREDTPPPAAILKHLCRLLDAKIVVGIVSGRGGSIREQLRLCMPERTWEHLHLGLYNGGRITTVAGDDSQSEGPSEFLSHAERIVRRLKGLGVPIEYVRTTHPYQVSVRFREGLQSEALWPVIADALRQAGLAVTQMVRSKHSVDILAPGVDKSRLIAELIHHHRLAPYEILAIGDQGAWPGNDFSLLEHKYALSVDSPSRRLDRGWKLCPPHKREVDATVWYLDRIHILDGGKFKLNLSSSGEVAETQ